MIYVLKFGRILSLSDEVSISNLEISENYSIEIVQHFHFSELFNSLERNKNVPSSFRKFYPFLDEFGLIRVGGRLINASVGFDYKHQILLPKNSHFVALLVEYMHKKHIASGPHLLHSILMSKYWIIEIIQNGVK